MIITPIDNRLFQITNVLPEQLLQKVLQLDWLNLSWGRELRQETWKRRAIASTASDVIAEASQCIADSKSVIEEACNIEILFTPNNESTTWWVDEPNFFVPIHTDGPLMMAMQLFWHSPAENLGTKFYNTNSVYDLKYDFKFTPNTGYLMLNMPDETGFQPLQYHGMLYRVPKDTYRLTSYTVFGHYNAK